MQRKCVLCNGTGFYKGNICECISNKRMKDSLEGIKNSDLPDCIKDLFSAFDERGGKNEMDSNER